MGLDRARAEHELLGDLAVGPARGDEQRDLALARGQRGERPGRRVAGGPHDAVAEPAQLADRLVAPAQRAEAVEAPTRRRPASRPPPAPPAAASARPSASRARAGRAGRRAAASRASAAAAAASSGRAWASSTAERAAAVSARAHGVPERAAAASASLSARSAAVHVAARELRFGEVGGRGRADRPAGRRAGPAPPKRLEHRGDGALGVAGGDERRAEAPAGLARGVKVRSRSPLSAASPARSQRGADVAGREPRRGQGAVRPQQHPRVAGQARELEALLGGRARVGRAAELDQRRHRLDGELQPARCSRPVSAASAAPRSRVAERGLELAERAPRAAEHPERGQARRQLLGR